jgi:hypothetical protein
MADNGSYVKTGPHRVGNAGPLVLLWGIETPAWEVGTMAIGRRTKKKTAAAHRGKRVKGKLAEQYAKEAHSRERWRIMRKAGQ